MGLPWETIIKEFRNHSKNKNFDTVSSCAESFLKYLELSESVFSAELQKEYVFQSFVSYCVLLKDDIKEKLQSLKKTGDKIKLSLLKEISRDVVEEHLNNVTKNEVLPFASKEFCDGFLAHYDDQLNQAIEVSLGKLPLFTDSRKKLKEIALGLFTRDIFPSNATGIVVSGFGDNEVCPALEYYVIEAIINGKLKYKIKNRFNIDNNNEALVIAFAQSEMVHLFMEGIDPKLGDFQNSYIENLFKKLPDILVSNLDQYSDDDAKMLEEQLSKVFIDLLIQYKESMANYRQNSYVEPITSVVRILQKDELAEMAEALVNLTSFKRKMSMELETVGGPIDVALISKGEGLVWMKRKHYFTQDLNPRYLIKLLSQSLDIKGENHG